MKTTAELAAQIDNAMRFGQQLPVEFLKKVRDALLSSTVPNEKIAELERWAKMTAPVQAWPWRSRLEDAVNLLKSFTPSAIVPKWLVRAGGDCYETWLCSTREDVRHAFMEALYGDVATAQSENTGDIASFMEDFDRRIVADKDVRWSFEDGWLEVIELNGRADDGAEKNG